MAERRRREGEEEEKKVPFQEKGQRRGKEKMKGTPTLHPVPLSSILHIPLQNKPTNLRGKRTLLDLTHGLCDETSLADAREAIHRHQARLFRAEDETEVGFDLIHLCVTTVQLRLLLEEGRMIESTQLKGQNLIVGFPLLLLSVLADCLQIRDKDVL